VSFARRASRAFRRYSDFGSTEKDGRSGVRDDESDEDRVVEGDWVWRRACLCGLGVDIFAILGALPKVWLE
jgi:hypothetical protein